MGPKLDLKTILDLHAKWLRSEPGGQRADLSSANLSYANLRSANLSSAILSYADLRSADLRYANLSFANLKNCPAAELALAIASHLPEGPFHAWKKCQNGVLVRLLIPEDAKRSHGSERKCRASKAVVLEVIGAEVGISLHDGKTEYRVGQTVLPDGWDEDRWNTCGQGIHFYITRLEAEAHTWEPPCHAEASSTNHSPTTTRTTPCGPTASDSTNTTRASSPLAAFRGGDMDFECEWLNAEANLLVAPMKAALEVIGHVRRQILEMHRVEAEEAMRIREVDAYYKFYFGDHNGNP